MPANGRRDLIRRLKFNLGIGLTTATTGRVGKGTWEISYVGCCLLGARQKIMQQPEPVKGTSGRSLGTFKVSHVSHAFF